MQIVFFLALAYHLEIGSSSGYSLLLLVSWIFLGGPQISILDIISLRRIHTKKELIFLGMGTLLDDLGSP